MTSPLRWSAVPLPVASQSDMALFVRQIKLHHASGDNSTQCVLIVAPMGGRVKVLPASA
jgi:hypothetical protein